MMKKSLFIIFALVVMAFSTIAQESEELLYSEYSDKSLIREIDDGVWLIYSHPGYCDFSLVIDGNSNIDILRLDDELFISVTDFETFDSIVYLCGIMNTGTAYMGYFDLAAFPSASLYYIELKGITNIKKLEVIPSRNTLCQVIMTGDDINGTSYVIDAVPSATVWNVNLITATDEFLSNPIYEDVAVVDNYVVITSYDCNIVDNNADREPRCTGALWYFDRPNTPTAPLDIMTMSAKRLTYLPTIPFLIKKCEDSVFVIATKDAYGGIIVSEFSGKNLTGETELQTEQFVLKDISYNVDSNSTDVLLDPPGHWVAESVIYTITPSSYIMPLLVSGRIFRHGLLNSIVYQSHNVNHFIGTGIGSGNNDYSNLHMYRYTIGSIYHNCAIEDNVKSIPKPKILYNRPGIPHITTIESNIMEKETIKKGTITTLTCGTIK